MILIFTLVCVNINISAQNDPTLYPIIDINNISIKSSSGTLVPLNCTIQHFTEVFGQPDSIKNKYWEMEEKTANIYYYGGSHFAFLDNKLVLFDIVNNSFHIGNAETDTFVGADISTLPTYFPHVSNVQPPGFLIANINNNEILIDDEFISLEYNSDKKITKICIRTY